MIIGTGTDLCKIDRIEASIQRFGNKLQEKICSEQEQAHLERHPQHKVRRLAQMFAAKEACTKALGTGLSQGVFMRDIKMGADSLGKPTLTLTHGALTRLQFLTPTGFVPFLHVSLTDEAGLAHAMVIAEVLPKEYLAQISS